MLRPEDLEFLKTKGISSQQVEDQLARFATGFPYLKIKDVARPGYGITVLSPEEEETACRRWAEYLASGGDVCKFVPASGAASRMFKALFEFVDGDADSPTDGSAVADFIAGIDKLAFLSDLEDTVMRLYKVTVRDLIKDKRYKQLIAAIIKPEGMNYGGLPKGLLKFHSYPDGSRTPVEEQLVEGAQTAAAADGVVKLHFTVSGAHKRLFEEKIAEAVPLVEKHTGVKFEISLSEQKSSTDTVAANPDNTPFLEDGHLLFRPGGHGALIENLNDIDAAVVFIKNIDNVVPDNRRDVTVRYKQVIGGYMMQLHDKIGEYLNALRSGSYTRGMLQDMLSFMHFSFSQTDRNIDKMNDTELALYIHGKLNRPLRVCGMVRNEGEPGGGPFVAYNPDASASLQILESHQIDPKNADYARMMASATHFNPVDLVCYIKDYNGDKYDLLKHVDPATGFISEKSSHGRVLRALELPGLWNGAMSDWNTAFVEVPIETFNPVKTVNDLLRPAHQG